jgi:hypothetical protein
MAEGQGNITYGSTKGGGGGGGGTVTAANNGLSLNGTTVVWGNDLGDALQPAKLLNDREINLNAFSMEFDSGGILTSNMQISGVGAGGMLNFFKGLAGQNPIEILTVQGKAGTNNAGNFWVTLDESYVAPDGQRDAVLQWGYNQNGGGGTVIGSECEVHYAIESHFNAGGSYQNEVHLESTAIDGTKNRIYSFDINIFNGTCEGYFTADGIAFYASGFSDSGTPYFQMSASGGFSSFGPAAGMSIINSLAGYGNIVLTTNVDGSVNIGNTGGGTNPSIAIANNIVINNASAAFPSIDIALINSDGIEGIYFSGTVSAGSGTALPIFAQIDATGAVAAVIQNLGAGPALYEATVLAGGVGDAYYVAKNSTNADAYSFGLQQASGNYMLAAGTNLESPNLYTVTPTAQTGFGGNVTPTAYVHIAASGGTPGTGPLKLTPGTLLAVPEDGTIEYDGTNFYKTIGAVRTIIL